MKVTDHVSAEQMLGFNYTPKLYTNGWGSRYVQTYNNLLGIPLTNKPAELETLSELACVPNALYVIENRVNPFNDVFRYMVLLKQHGGRIRTSKSLPIHLMMDIVWETDAGANL